MNLDTVILGDCTEMLKTLPDQSINCCVTSPPYYGLRDYGTGEWVGGDPNCPHRRTSKYSDKTITGHAQPELAGNVGDAIYKTVCKQCGAVRVDKQIGLEETPEEYIERLVMVFREVKRVLKDDGTLWVNIGDSYWGSGSRGFDFTGKLKPDVSKIQGSDKKYNLSNVPSLMGNVDGYKNKDMIGIPWMLAFALRNDGWYLRQDIIWHKPNPMPESVTDRCTKSHEYIFLLSKKPRYYFDHEAIQEAAVGDPNRYKYPIMANEKEQMTDRPGQKPNTGGIKTPKYKSVEHESSMRQGMSKDRGKNLVFLRKNLPSQEEFTGFMRNHVTADFLEQSTDIKRTKIDHWFRTDSTGFSYPSVEDWIKIRDYVNDYSEQFKVIDASMTDVTVETDEIGKSNKYKNLMDKGQTNHTMHERRAEGMADEMYMVRNKRDVWSVTTKPCKEAHFAVFPEDLIEPCILAGCPAGGVVLDPFFGSGTTGRVATKFNRHYIGIELNPEYVEISNRRTDNVQLTMEGFI